jgi:hypothetical protein
MGIDTALIDNKIIQDKLSEIKRNNTTTKLSQYNDPSAHFRMVREEVSKAIED